MQRWYSGPGRWMRYEILEKDTEIRLDRWLRQTFPSLTHSHVQKLIRTRKIRLLQDEKHIPTTSNALLMKGILIAFDSYLFDQISMEQTHETKRNKVQQLDHKMEKKLLQSIVYEDENYIILDKPNDIAVQVSTYHDEISAQLCLKN
jgi:23S rRNA-/tRNA-specific pseudouridylate synthase